jgi:uncharacterized membrane protein
MFGIPFHKLIVHFPIALTLAAFAYDMRALYAKRPELHDIGYRLSLWSAVSVVPAVITGLSRAGALGLDSGAITGHTAYGIGSGLVLVAFGVRRYTVLASGEHNSSYYAKVWTALQFLGFLLISVTAITGHRLFG